MYSFATAAVGMALAALTSAAGSKAPVAAAADATTAAEAARAAAAMQARAAIEQAVEPAKEVPVKVEVVCLDSSGDHVPEDDASAPADAGIEGIVSADHVEDELPDNADELPAKRGRRAMRYL